MTSTNCPICCESYDKSTRTIVKCELSECQFEACKTCVRKYMLNSPLEQNCMKCFKPWSEGFIIRNLNRSFVDKNLTPHRRQVLLEKELARIPETIPIAEKLAEIRKEEEEILKIADEINKLKILIRRKQIQQNEHRKNIDIIKGTKKERREFIMPCPNENCRGFLNQNYYCSLCKFHTCPKCIEIIGYNKDDPHTCDENSVANADLIKKETKPCPACGERIFHNGGCDQMWCTKPDCHTAFSWRTGMIETGVIHNPHYYEFQRKANNGNIPRNPGDIVNGCDNRLIMYRDLTRISRFIDPIHKINNLHQCLNHFIHAEIRQKRQRITDLENNENLRIEYIFKTIDKDKLAKTVTINHRKRKEYIEIVNIYELFTTFGIELFNGFINVYNEIRDIPPSMVEELLTNFHKIREYCNTELGKISVTYNHKVQQIDENWVYTTKKFNMK